MEQATTFILEQALYSSRDHTWGFRFWSEHATMAEARKAAKGLKDWRILETKFRDASPSVKEEKND